MKLLNELLKINESSNSLVYKDPGKKTPSHVLSTDYSRAKIVGDHIEVEVDQGFGTSEERTFLVNFTNKFGTNAKGKVEQVIITVIKSGSKISSDQQMKWVNLYDRKDIIKLAKKAKSKLKIKESLTIENQEVVNEDSNKYLVGDRVYYKLIDVTGTITKAFKINDGNKSKDVYEILVDPEDRKKSKQSIIEVFNNEVYKTNVRITPMMIAILTRASM